MTDQEKINFRQVRDFGETFNVSVKFFRQNFKLFFQSLIFIAGPFVLISAIAGAFYQSSTLSMFSMLKMGGSELFSQFGWTYLIFILATILANLMLLGTVFSFMINYFEKGPLGFTVNEVGQLVVKNIGKIMSVFFVLMLLTLVAIAIVIGLIVLLASISSVLGILFGIGLFFGLLILLPPLIWQLSVVYLVKMQEGKGVLDSIGRTRKVIRDNFWWTWVIMVCAVFAVGIISFVFALPQALYQFILIFSAMKGGTQEVSTSFLIVATVCTFCSTLLYSCLYVISAFHYYSLVEQKDGIGLMERIDEIGNTPVNNVEQQY